MSHKAVFGIYPDQLSVEDGIDALREAGFRNADISLLYPENQGDRDFAYERHSKAPEGAAAGGGSGAVLGGAVGWLVGIGALTLPGAGAFVAAGPIMAMLGGIGLGGTLGGITGALLGLGIPEYEAKRYEGRIRRGGVLLSVHCDDTDWVHTAKLILAQTGAEDVATGHEARADFGISDRPELRTRVHSEYLSREQH